MFSFGFASMQKPSPVPDPAGLEDDFVEDEEASVGDEINDVLVSLLPWGLSIAFHVILIIAAFYYVWAVILPAEEEQTIIPDARLSDTPGAEIPIETVEKQESSDSPRTTPTTDPNTNPPSPAVTNTAINSQLTGIQFHGGVQGGSFGNTDGNGDFGVNFLGTGGNARRLAFVVDASGSMVGVLPFVINELKKVISELSAQQQFTIIFFTGEGVFEVPGGGQRSGIRPASPQFKQECSAWITLSAHNIEPRGRGSVNAVAAIELALASKPHLVFLLSDNLTGGGIGATTSEIFQEEVMDALRDANTGNPPAKFNTIQFLYVDPLIDAGLKGTLQLIAEETGGVYKFLDDRALNLR